MITKKDIPKQSFLYEDTISTISFTENGKTYSADNPKKFKILSFRVDGTLITGNSSIRCDYAFTVNDDICFLIELKGLAIPHECRQILETKKIFYTQYYHKIYINKDKKCTF